MSLRSFCFSSKLSVHAPAGVARFVGGVMLVAGGLGGAALAQGGQSQASAATDPLTYEADKGQADLVKKRYTLKGRVRVTQGRLDIRAQEAVVQQQSDGSATVVVTGVSTEPARFEQKKPGTQETLVGQSARIDYDNRTQIVIMRGNATLKRYQRDTLVDEVLGSVITYNQVTEAFQVDGGDARPAGSPQGGDGRVRGVLSSGPVENSK